jgi:hypothetical protein
VASRKTENHRKDNRRKIRRSKHAVEKTNLAVNMQYRKAFKKAAMPDKRKEKMAVNSLAYMQPEDITRNNITSNAATAEKNYKKL